ncbi:MAG: tyrosine-type recombinase/integrase [Opitutales bacterium]|nr:tyrosine-type recombinase/integrase [Opitutales bacterium]NRA28232.1 tyrosine-type recombinase/integrase [Opitutales bacterium]
MEAADIPRLDALGRRRDFHSFRGTFATSLAAHGVAPRVAQELMRYRDPQLTAKVYTDTFELPVLNAVNSLPWIENSAKTHK